MPSALAKTSEKIARTLGRFEQGFETNFERLARDPRVLAFLASSLNYASALKIEIEKLETEVLSHHARLWGRARSHTWWRD